MDDHFWQNPPGVFVDPGYNSYQKISLLGLLEVAKGIFSKFFFASKWSHRRAPIPMFFGVLLAALVILDLASHRPDVFRVELQQFHSNGGKDRKGVNKFFALFFLGVPFLH